MPKLTVTFAHSHGDRVNIIALEGCVGIVETMSASILGLDYRVAYWHDGRRHSEWLRGDEIVDKTSVADINIPG